MTKLKKKAKLPAPALKAKIYRLNPDSYWEPIGVDMVLSEQHCECCGSRESNTRIDLVYQTRARHSTEWGGAIKRLPLARDMLHVHRSLPHTVNKLPATLTPFCVHCVDQFRAHYRKPLPRFAQPEGLPRWRAISQAKEKLAERRKPTKHQPTLADL